jgi:Phospholipase/Carboxylesterase/MORN repeat variant
MKFATLILSLIICIGSSIAQKIDTFYLHIPNSKKDIIYKRIIQSENNDKLYYVRDYYPDGQIQMEGTYSSFDKNIKEESLMCNYRTNTKEGEFKVWYKSGQIESKSNFLNGLSHGLQEYWYSNGQRESTENYRNGQEDGNITCWDTSGTVEGQWTYNHGLNQNPKDVNYHYISYTPKEYNEDTIKKWPLIIYLHGGSGRGTDTIKLYCCGIPDLIWRGRKFPFIIVAPQCPVHHRWSTDNWFENFYKDVTTKYRVDTNKVYLTGVSLGGDGTWYLAIKYPEKFAAIAPMSGFTRHIDYVMNNTDKLIDIPVWAFHGKIDKVVQFEDTEWMINQLKGKNEDLKFTADPEVGHWIDWLVYPQQELYDWFLKHDKRLNNH